MKLADLPDKPGVYLFMDRAAAVIYVGKAKSLKKRVRSHFGKDNLDARHISMISQVRTVDYIQTKNEKEALVLEDQLIKTIRPRYNILLKDGKTYPYLEVTTGDRYPSLRVTRKKDNPSSLYFGPFPNVRDMRRAKSAADRIFPLRKCAKFRENERPCLNYQIGRCLSPCTGAPGEKEYGELVEELILFLKGKSDLLDRKLNERMRYFKENLEFEKAAAVRDQILRLNSIFPVVNVRRITKDKLDAVTRIDPLLHLKEVLSLPHIPRVIEGFDISHTSTRMAVGSMVRFVNGEPDKSGYRKFRIRQEETSDDLSMLREVIYRRLKRIIRDNGSPPDIIFVDGGKGQEKAARTVAESLGLHSVTVLSLAKEKGNVYRKGKKAGIFPGSEAFNLLKRVDDEAHRFAHSYHTKRRGSLQ